MCLVRPLASLYSQHALSFVTAINFFFKIYPYFKDFIIGCCLFVICVATTE